VRYVYGITGAILLGGAAATLSLNPLGAQVAQNEPGAIAATAPGGAPMSFANLAERLQPAVVNISTRQSITTQRRQLPPGFEEFFRRFGGDAQTPPQGEGPVTQRGGSLGSGFIISADGYIVTNNHVVAPARPDAVVEQITVTLTDRTEFEAEVVGRDVASDIALLKITPTRPLPFVRFADSTQVRVGDWVVAIGNPFGLGGTVTAGIVSALHRNIGAGLYDRYIQTDASINSGNSGGPMFDLNGNVIGIATALISPTGGNVGIGFGIPAEQIRPVVEALRRGERFQRGYIGVGMQDVDEGVAAALGIDRNRGTLIRSVTPGGPAARGGIQQGDVVVSVAGHPVTPDATLAYLISQQAIGSRVPLEVIRQGQRRTVNVAIAERPTEEELARLNGIEDDNAATGNDAAKPAAPSQSPGQRSTQQSLGLSLQPLTPGDLQRLQIRDASVRGLVIGSVDPNSDAGQKGLQPGDVILSIDQTATPTPEAAAAAVDAARRARRNTVLLLVKRGNNPPAFYGIELRTAAR
jgi:serine protease Do